MAVELREITKETVRAICNLDVADDQREFVAPNALSIAQAHFEPKQWMRAIYVDDKPVGFILTDEDPTKGAYYLWRFMVAAQHQRQGIGRRAMGLLIDRWRAIGAGSATLSIVEPNGVALAFYESLGFQLTGEREHGELVMRLEL